MSILFNMNNCFPVCPGTDGLDLKLLFLHIIAIDLILFFSGKTIKFKCHPFNFDLLYFTAENHVVLYTYKPINDR